VAETPESAAGSGRLAVLEAGRPTSTLVELGQSVILGRDPGCDVRLADPNVSRRHASIERVAGGWTVRDLATKNPSRVIGPGGSSFEVGMGVSLASGQLLVGDALITLYP
jgi:predicted component of type VI protein secretion system